MQMRNRYRIVCCSLFAVLVCVVGCSAPGKPGPPEVAPEDQLDFATLFRTNCQGCHGIDGKGGPGRILNNPLYLAILPRQELRNIIENGRPGTAMPAWSLKNAGPFSEKQIDSIVNGIEKSWAKPAAFQGKNLPSYYGSQGGDVLAGQKTFLRDCFMCHGPGARVGSVTDAAFLSLITNQCLRTSIIVGRPDLGMPDYSHLAMGRALTDDDINNLVVFLSSKRPPAVTAMFESARAQQERGQMLAGQQTGATGAHESESGTGQQGTMTQGNKGSGFGPGSPSQQKTGNNTTPSSQGAVK